MKTKDIFLDMLTDSGTNAMSDNQFAGFMTTDDAYSGSMTFYDFADAVRDVLGYKYTMNAHQGRAAEHLLAKTFVEPGQVVPTNYHFTTTKVHIELPGAKILEIYYDEALETKSTNPFKGNMDPQKLRDVIKKYGKDQIQRIKVTGEPQYLTETSYLDEIRNLGYKPLTNRESKRAKSFFHMMNWLKKNPDKMKYAKTGWPRLSRYHLFRSLNH